MSIIARAAISHLKLQMKAPRGCRRRPSSVCRDTSYLSVGKRKPPLPLAEKAPSLCIRNPPSRVPRETHPAYQRKALPRENLRSLPEQAPSAHRGLSPPCSERRRIASRGKLAPTRETAPSVCRSKTPSACKGQLSPPAQESPLRFHEQAPSVCRGRNPPATEVSSALLSRKASSHRQPKRPVFPTLRCGDRTVWMILGWSWGGHGWP